MRADGSERWYGAAGFGACLLLLAQYCAADGFMSQPVYQLQWNRALDILGLFAVIGVARILSAQARTGAAWVSAWIAAWFLVMTTGVQIPREIALTSTLLFLGLLVLEGPKRWLSSGVVLLVTVFLFVEAFTPTGPGRGLLGKNLWTPSLLGRFGAGFALFLAIVYSEKIPWFWLRRALGAIGLGGALVLISTQFLNAWPFKPESRVRWMSRICWPGQGMQKEWNQVQLWVRDHTSPGAMFFTPPNMEGFRMFSRRSTFVEYKDGAPSIFNPVYGKAWSDRMKIVGYWPLTVGAKANRQFHSLTAEQWISLARLHAVDYLVTNQPVSLSFSKLHQVGNFSIWQLPRVPPPSPPSSAVPPIPSPQGGSG
ncbi:MAG: hypothetical protein HY360_23365 [Verrucomicrobia bacterium]|nr:hypothetical protein [Verrucomicrobiota bacterium]